RRVMDCGPSAHSRATSRSRVRSPSAANTGAASVRLTALRRLDMALDVARLLRPTPVVHPERLRAARRRDALEARLDDRESRALCHLLEAKLDQRRRLGRVVDLRVDRVRMPSVRKEPLGYDPFDEHFHGQVLVTGIGDLTANRR